LLPRVSRDAQLQTASMGSPVQTPTSAISTEDRDFMNEVATGGMAEVELGGLAA
jgi:putative membrane protein